MFTETTRRGIALFAIATCMVALLVGSTLFLRDVDDLVLHSKAQAQATQVAQCKEIRLEPGQKLESVSWACAPGGYCVPTWLTRPMRPGEPIETHTLHNEKGAYDIYIFEERPAPR